MLTFIRIYLLVGVVTYFVLVYLVDKAPIRDLTDEEWEDLKYR